ncbi:MAG: threonylcarbamoyl-AMP synthase [Chlorobi bacterium]|nr:threonylcarbamoyl-AMP synthase [Chlorobiota bacterium]
MLIKLYPDNPDSKQIDFVVDILKKGGLIIYPTDTIYALGCDSYNNKAVEKVARIKGVNPKKANFSFICYDFKHLSQFTRPLNNTTFKLMKHCLPGPFTFILPANSNVPKLFKNNKKTVGIRIPNNNIIREITRVLGNPILTTSVKDDDDIIEYTTDPELIHEKFGDIVDVVIDGGFGENEPSTVIDCTGDECVIVRQGKGLVDL